MFKPSLVIKVPKIAELALNLLVKEQGSKRLRTPKLTQIDADGELLEMGVPQLLLHRVDLVHTAEERIINSVTFSYD